VVEGIKLTPLQNMNQRSLPTKPISIGQINTHFKLNWTKLFFFLQENCLLATYLYPFSPLVHFFSKNK
jgi:hypothetical protein